MKKFVLRGVLINMPFLVYASTFNYTNFQHFDNQVSFGVNYQNGNFSSSQSNGSANQYSITALNLEVEKLFDIGIWGDFNASVAQTYTQTITYDNTANPSQFPTQPVGSYPFLQTINLKLGYNFPLMDSLAITPYLLLGKNANLTSYTTFSGTEGIGPTPTNVTNDFYYSYGAGLRLEYVINKYVDLYLDQSYARNNDQTSYSFQAPGQINTSNNQMTTTLGVKVNPWEKLQLATNLMYTNYAGYDQGSMNFLNSVVMSPVPTTAFGFQFSAGFTFE